jgi:hypothetical protein
MKGVMASLVAVERHGRCYGTTGLSMRDTLQTDELERCHDRIAELEEENRLLRESSEMFAELAERLSAALENRRTDTRADPL